MSSNTSWSLVFSSIGWVDGDVIFKCAVSVVEWLFIKFSLKYHEPFQLQEIEGSNNK